MKVIKYLNLSPEDFFPAQQQPPSNGSAKQNKLNDGSAEHKEQEDGA